MSSASPNIEAQLLKRHNPFQFNERHRVHGNTVRYSSRSTEGLGVGWTFNHLDERANSALYSAGFRAVVFEFIQNIHEKLISLLT